ncbi:cation:proton antiporter [Caenispirillum bisanense]|uniref:Sodium/proton antiporter, CPA1 family n=1 Tax=Caenispirillum bisanense TaxID=414052 RepID=A0A286G925_9PROT|nr:sodium:proton antiporter [Caenispirillum bisanense]SOD92021.1 sodium/proton antiporter, CPA1 family [Caenispirillum bisanense]
MDGTLFIFVATTIVGGVAAQWVGWRTRIPPIVLLFGLGLVVGPVTGLIRPGEQLGHGLEVIVGMAVAVVVFEGGLKLDLRELREVKVGISRLVVLGLPLNWLFGTLAAHWIVGVGWGPSVLFGAIMVVTGPTVILPLLRQVRLKRRPASLLKWEAVVNDPFGAMIAVLVLEYLIVVAPHEPDGSGAVALLGRVMLALLASGIMALAAALAVRHAFHRDKVPEVLRTPLLLAGALGLYAAANLLQAEAGLFAATVFGLALANLQITGLKPLSRNKESLSTMLVSALFILLAANLSFADFETVPWAVAVLVGVVLVAVRPAAILIATLWSGLPWRERLLVAWIGPRGIVAAALAGIAGGRLADAGYRGADLIEPMVYAVIAASVVFQGMTLGPLARRLGLRGGSRPGILIVGANPWTTRLAQVLGEAGVPVLMADQSWAALRPAREHDIPGLAVEILSAEVEAALDSGFADYVLAATEDDAYNALVCARFAPELGRERVHQLALAHGKSRDSRRLPELDWRGKIVAAPGLDFATANDLLREGWRFEVRHPQALDGSIGDQVRGPGDLPLMILKEDGRIVFNTRERTARARDGDCLVYFAPPPEESPARADARLAAD